MPELPEVETVVRGITPSFKDQQISKVILNRPDLRFPFPKKFCETIEQQTVIAVYRRAKYICIDLSNNHTLLWHLGMSGRVVLDESEPDDKHDHVEFHLSSGKRVRYRDPRRFGFMDLVPTHIRDSSKFISHLGPEPLSDEFSVDYLKKALSRRKGPIKPAIMDAKLVVGVGNIYASEALFQSKIHPETPAYKVANLDDLVVAIKDVLQKAIRSGGSTLRDHARPDGELGYFQHHFHVYGKADEKCGTCQSSPVQQIKQAGRSTFFCNRCQKI